MVNYEFPANIYEPDGAEKWIPQSDSLESEETSVTDSETDSDDSAVSEPDTSQPPDSSEEKEAVPDGEVTTVQAPPVKTETGSSENSN